MNFSSKKTNHSGWVSQKKMKRRSFAITIQIMTDPQSMSYKPSQVYEVARKWMQDRAWLGRDYLTGLFQEGCLAHVVQTPTGPVGRLTRGIVLSGEVCSLDISDEEVEGMLNELAELFGTTLKQTQVHISYLDKAWILCAEESEKSEPSCA